MPNTIKKSRSKNLTIGFALAGFLSLAAAPGVAQSYSSNAPAFNFSYSAPAGFQGYTSPYTYGSTAYSAASYTTPTYSNATYSSPTYSSGTYNAPTYSYQTPVVTTTTTQPVIEEVSTPFAFSRRGFRPYAYIRASGEYMFNKYPKTDAAAQQIQFEEETKALGLRAGFMFSRNFGIEARGAYGMDTETQVVGTATSAHQVKGYIAAMARVQADFGSMIVPYANVGVGAVRTEFGSVSGGTVINTEETKMGLAAALGVELNVSQGLVLGLEGSYLPTKLKTIGITAGFNF